MIRCLANNNTYLTKRHICILLNQWNLIPIPMTCSNYANLDSPVMTESEMTNEYWYEFLYPRVLEFELEIENEILDANYGFYKMCRNFNWNRQTLKSYLLESGYRNIRFFDETEMIVFINNNRNLLISWVFSLAFKDWAFILAIKCNTTKIIQTKNAVRLKMDGIGMC
ncbi:MAG: hypothetical protein ACD_2C00244G0002 [uncultured bacterium (gcode 4)]|uniref:Uncharacterized protein n=1 Tax=uncultured bacterium (gcode 4) TaxID=1234023 RepID=K2GFF5_9BACT|nr:MAG: hypothetical protein ACD_2C00244G0002 [uncultured bacterium (gcode 4)]